MAPTHSANPGLPQAMQTTLLSLARDSIHHGLSSGRALSPSLHDYPPELLEQQASFVTLNKNETLRGCMGHLEAVQSLIEDVCENAYAAAFKDPRFPALTTNELNGLTVSISILTPAKPLPFSSEEELIAKLRPGVDGLIMERGGNRGTFLPSVWKVLPDPVDFLRHLKQKAGLSALFWSDDLEVLRYETESFSE